MNLHGGHKKNTQLFFVEKALYVRRGAQRLELGLNL